MSDELSPEGMQRRDAILRLAQSHARKRRSTRLLTRTTSAIAAVAVLVTICLKLQMPSATRVISRSVAPPIAVTPPISEPSPPVAVEYIQTDPTITDRLTIKPQPPRWTSIEDDELFKTLADAGQPAGIVCINGKTTLFPRQ